MSYAGYDFIEENPETRLVFYDPENEYNVQLWLKDDDNTELCIKFIAGKARENGVAFGKYIAKSAIKKALEL